MKQIKIIKHIDLSDEQTQLLASAKTKECTTDEIYALLFSLRNGNKDAIKVIVESKEYQIVKEAIRLNRNDIPMSRLIQAGKQSLSDMLNKYGDSDELKELFISYSNFWIQQGIVKAVKDL